MLTQPVNSTAHLALERPKLNPRRHRAFVPVFYLNPPKMSGAERQVRAGIRQLIARNLRVMTGAGYRAAVKWLSQTATPRIEGTLRLPARRARHVALAGMVC